MKKIPFELHTDTIYKPSDIAKVLELAVNDKNLMASNKGEKGYNIPCAFDIETTSFYRDENKNAYSYAQYQELNKGRKTKLKLEKVSIMYVWQFGINGYCIVGRTWKEFLQMCDVIAKTLELSENKKLIVYIHNLSYEFQYIRTLFEWEKVFSIDLRKPIYATTKTGIEFRCSYLLSGYSLAKLGEQLHTYHIEKMVGDLDYQLMRNSKTPLSDKEIKYCVNDVFVVMAYIQELIEEYKGLRNLPITKTGFVRKYCRKHCLRKKDETGKTVVNWDYTNLIHSLTIGGLEEFNMLQRAFAGGFTHANGMYTDETLSDVTSYDFTSSYPTVMVAEQFPMSSGVRVEVKSTKQFEFLTTKFCCIFDIEFNDIFASQTQDNPISSSKCFIKEHVAENNGRVVCAKRLVMTITDVDFNIIKNFYTWKSMRVGRMYCYKRGYLPTEFVQAILHLYEKKTKLKGVKGKEVEYLNSKEMLNSCYGMCVTNPLRDEFTYNGKWDTQNLSNKEKIETLGKYNTSRNRFLFYPWGVFVTAYARRNLFSGIYTVGNDYVYSDTDSIKLLNADKYKDYFKQYNERITYKLRCACKYHGLSFELCQPVTVKGITKPLGVWDFDGFYKHFKTLGAKRYMVEEEDALTVGGKSYDYSLTVSGVNKKTAIPFLLEKYGKNRIFAVFSNYLSIPESATGKKIHTYIDYEVSGEMSDYLGNKAHYDEKTGVHLEPTGYTLSLSVMYINYLRGIKFKD